MKLLPFNDYDLKTSKILEALNKASRSLAELKGFASPISNQHILINTITINEAKDSSAIENIVTTHDSIYKVLKRCGVTRQTAVTYLNSLVNVGLLELEKIGRESIYKNTRLIDLLSKF